MMDSMRNSVGFIPVLKGGSAVDDNLAIALCTYFSNHPERPDDDEEDEQTGWGEWVIEKADDLIDRVIRNVLDEKAMQRKGTAVSSVEKQSEGKAL